MSILYIYQTRKYLRDSSPLLERSWSTLSAVGGGNQAHKSKQKIVLRQLIYSNVLIIALDITLLGIQCADLFYLQGAFKPCVYGIKLKVEFIILNRLLNSIQKPYNGEIYVRSGIASDSSAGQNIGHNGIWYKQRGQKSTGENEEVELAHSNDGNNFKSKSSESQALILAA